MTMNWVDRDHEEARTNEESAQMLADNLRLGPVRFIWTDGYTAHGVYLVPARDIKTRLGKWTGG